MAKRRRKPKINREALAGKYTGFADPYRQSYSTDELLALRRKYAKAVNQRLVRARDYGFKISDSPALEMLSKQGRKRFSEVKGIPKHLMKTDAKTGKISVDRNALKREISTLTGFLGSVRTTREGRKAIFKETSKTFKKNFGVDLKPDHFEYLLNNFNDFKSAIRMNSDAVLNAIGDVSSDITSKDQLKRIFKELEDKKTVQEQAAAIYDATYKKKKNRPARAEKIDSIIEAIIK